jgi:hypothetical protein
MCWLHFLRLTKTLDDFPITQLGIYVMLKKGKVDIDVQGFPLVTGFVTGWEGFQFRRGGSCYKGSFLLLRLRYARYLLAIWCISFIRLFGDGWGNSYLFDTMVVFLLCLWLWEGFRSIIMSSTLKSLQCEWELVDGVCRWRLWMPQGTPDLQTSMMCQDFLPSFCSKMEYQLEDTEEHGTWTHFWPSLLVIHN